MSVPSARSATTGVAVTLLLAIPVGSATAQEELARAEVQRPFAATMGVAGDAVEGLGLRLTNLETDVSTEAVSGADGSFGFRDLAPGPYRLHLIPSAGGPADTISIALPRTFVSGPRDRAKKLREIVVVGMTEPAPDGARGIPSHTPEWTDLSDHDPGVTEADARHRKWIELASLSATGDGETLILTISPEAWEAAGPGWYFELFLGADREAPEGRAAGRPPVRCGDCEPHVVTGGVVFGDGVAGRRPAPAEEATPVLRAEPSEKP